MSCLIATSNLKIFGKAFHALARIADDLYIETLPSGLVFHTVNSSKSAYARFTFEPDFFLSYKDDASENRKILLKSCLMAFRSIPHLEKNVEKCLFDLTSASDYLLLKFFCKHGMDKVYKLNYVENETVQGTFPTSGFLCTLNASSRLLQDGIQNFCSSVEELTLTACLNKVLLRNYVDDEPDPNKVVHTELTLESEEFDSFQVTQETKITFCLKELKAVLNFCEGFNVPISIQCQAGGRPVTFGINGLKGVDVQFVLATLADKETQSVSSSSSVLRTNVKTSKKISVKTDKILHRPMNTSETDSYSSNNQSSHSKKVEKIPFENDSDGGSVSLLNFEEEMDDFDQIPSTPPHKKFRSMFLGLSQATCMSMATDSEEVLAPNSDEET